MVMGHNWEGASHGHATTTTDGNAELDAATRTGTGPRPRPPALRARAVRRGAEDRRRGDSACRRPARPVEAARSRHALRLAGSLSDRGPGGPDGASAWRLSPGPASTTRRSWVASR